MGDVVTQFSAFKGAETDITVSSGRRFTVRELSAMEQMNADRCAGDNLATAIYMRTAMAVVAIDDQKLQPAPNDLELQTRLQLIGGREFDELTIAFSKQLAPKPDEVKNLSAPDA
jgi:hypothetical protein